MTIKLPAEKLDEFGHPQGMDETGLSPRILAILTRSDNDPCPCGQPHTRVEHRQVAA